MEEVLQVQVLLSLSALQDMGSSLRASMEKHQDLASKVLPLLLFTSSCSARVAVG